MASWVTVQRIAGRILRFARLPLSLTQTETEGPSIRMATNEVLLPKTLASEGTSAIASKVGHEVGHPLVFPRNAHWTQYYTLLLQKLGYQYPKEAMNVLADLFVNDWCMTRTPWARAFRRWAPSFYQAGPTPDALWGFLCSMMAARLDELQGGGGAPRLSEPVDVEAYRLLFHDRGTRRARFESLAELLKDRFASPQEPPQLPVAMGGSESLPPLEPGAGDDQAKEYQEWLQAIGELGEQVVFEHVRQQLDAGGAGAGDEERGDRVARRTLFDMLELVAFRELLAIEDHDATANAQLEAGPLLTTPWRLTDRMSDLRVGDSLRRYGVMVPGLTTLKRVRGPQRRRSNVGRGTLFLVIDTSGSMAQTLAGVLVVGWAAALGARRFRDRVAALEFGSTPTYLVPPGYEYRRLKMTLETLEASGGTSICPALDQVIEVARRERRKPTTLILTDTWVSESDDAVLARLKAIKDIGGQNVVCCPTAEDLHGWVKEGTRRELLQAFALADLTSIRTAIRALR